MEFPLIKETGYTSFCDNHGTRYWEFKVNPRFYGLKRHLRATISHYSNDVSYANKFHVWIEYNGCVAPKEFQTDSFREAFNFLIQWAVKPLFKY